MALSPSLYQPLLPNQIRCLHLAPGLDGEPLAGELEIIDLRGNDVEESLPLEALSYVWGSNARTHTLELSGHSISITKSLHSALTRLRQLDSRRTLWADAICINQGDVSEKERQIPLMGRIFGSATRVVADMGETDEESDAAIDLVDKHWRTAICSGASAIRYGKALSPVETAWLLSMPPDAVDMAWADHELPTVDSAEWERVWRFLQRPWFSRVWIVQEFVLARDVLCLCGTRAFDWRSIMALFIDFEHGRAFVNAVYVRWSSGRLDPDLFTRHDMIRRMFFHRGVRLIQATPSGREFLSAMPPETTPYWRNSFLDLLHAYRHAGCAIARDRYFAILGLAGEHDITSAPELKPDYTSTDAEWAQRIGHFVLQLPGGAEAFMHSGLGAHTNMTVPSWSQHFSMSGNSPLADQAENDQLSTTAGPGSVFSVTMVPNSPDTVELKGHSVDRVLEMLQTPVEGDGQSNGSAESDAVRLQLLQNCGASINFFTNHVLGKSPPGLQSALDWSSLEAFIMATSVNATSSTSSYNAQVTAKAVLGFYLLLFDNDEVAKSLSYWRQALADKLWTDYGYRNVLPEATRAANDQTAPADVVTSQDNFGEMGPTSADSDTRENPNELSFEDFAFLSERLASDIGVVARIVDMTPAFSASGSFLSTPRGTAPDDEIWVISGCRLPVVLRRSAERPGQYRLVGTCYAQGIMFGEALEREGFRWDNVQLY